MDTAINLVVSCTNRKTSGPAPGLRLRAIPPGNADHRFSCWMAAVSSVQAPSIRAEALYSGDHWSIARTAPNWNVQIPVRLWICSAGYGLIRPEDEIKAYQATFSPAEPDYVGRGDSEPATATQRWWAAFGELPRTKTESPRSLSELLLREPDSLVVLALSRDYLKALNEDLKTAVSNGDDDRLAVISAGTAATDPTWKEYLVPADASLAYHAGGALASLNVRIARAIISQLNTGNVSRRDLIDIGGSLPRQERVRTARKPHTDDDVRAFVRHALERSPRLSSTRLLNTFRASGNACEQKRFGAIVHSLRQEMGSA